VSELSQGFCPLFLRFRRLPLLGSRRVWFFVRFLGLSRRLIRAGGASGGDGLRAPARVAAGRYA